MSSNEGWEDGDYYSENVNEFTWVFVLFILLSIIDCVLVFSALFGFYKEPNPILSLDNKRFKRIAIFCLCVSSAVGWITVVAWQLALNGRYKVGVDVGVVAVGLYGLNATLVILLFGMRLIYTFKDTNYKMSNAFRYWLIGFTIIVVVLFATGLVAVLARNGYIAVAAFGFLCTFCTVNGIVLLCIYLRKLTLIINDFLKEFGGLSISALHKLNRQLSDAYAAGEIEIVDADFADAGTTSW